MVQQLKLGFHSIGCWLESSLVAKNPHATCLEQPKKKKKNQEGARETIVSLVNSEEKSTVFYFTQKEIKEYNNTEAS